MVKYYVRCIKTNPEENHFTHLKTYVVSDNGIVGDDGSSFYAYASPLNGGENTVESLNRWFKPCGYEFELVIDFTEETEEAEESVTFKWSKVTCESIAEFLEIYFFQNIRDDECIDNLDYVHDILHVIEDLRNAYRG